MVYNIIHYNVYTNHQKYELISVLVLLGYFGLWITWLGHGCTCSKKFRGWPSFRGNSAGLSLMYGGVRFTLMHHWINAHDIKGASTILLLS